MRDQLKNIKDRDHLIDVMKGIAIFLVVAGHSIGDTENSINKMILSFHMAVFFFCTGMLWKSKKIDTVLFIKTKFSSFLFPQIMIGILNCVWYGLILGVILHKTQLSSLSWYSYFLTWFLPTMFYSIVLLRVICNRIDFNVRSAIGLSVILLVCMIILNFMGIDDKLHFSKIPFALFFIIAGYIFKKAVVRDKRDFILNKSKYFLPISIVVLGICSKLNSSVLWYINAYGNLALMIAGSFIGIYATMQCAYIFEKNKLIRYWGENSMTIYVYQFLTYRCFNLIFTKLISVEALSIFCTILCSTLFLSMLLKIIDKVKIYKCKFGVCHNLNS